MRKKLLTAVLLSVMFLVGGEAGASVNDVTSTFEKNIHWLDIDGTGLVLPNYVQTNQQYVTVIVEKFFDGGQSGAVIVDVVEETVTPPLIYSSVGDVVENRAVVSTEGKYGYIDQKGQLVIPVQYVRAYNFQEGHAIVSKMVAPACNSDTGLIDDAKAVVEKYGIIDQTGHIIVDFVYDSISYTAEGKYIAAYHNSTDGNCINGILDLKGNFEPIEAERLTSLGTYLIVINGANCAYYNFAGEKLSPVFPWKGALPKPTNNLVVLLDEHGKSGFYDLQLDRFVVQPLYDWIQSEGFMSGLAAVSYGEQEEQRKCGVINEQGNVVVPFLYKDIYPFSEGIAVARQAGDDGKIYYGGIERDGQIAIPFIYTYMDACHGGTVMASWNKSPYAMIDKHGERLTPYKYNYYDSCDDGIRIVGQVDTISMADGQEKTIINYGMLNHYGNEIVPLSYSGISAFYQDKALVGEGIYVQSQQQASERIGILNKPTDAERDNGVRAFITVTVNGQTVLFDQDPLLIGGRTLVPMRAILEALGAEVAWDQETQMLTAVRDTDTIMLTVGEQQGYVNGQPVQMEKAAQIIGGRVLVPVRFIAEGLQAKVYWNEDEKSIMILTKELR